MELKPRQVVRIRVTDSAALVTGKARDGWGYVVRMNGPMRVVVRVVGYPAGPRSHFEYYRWELREHGYGTLPKGDDYDVLRPR
jgi:hypothetical protein